MSEIRSIDWMRYDGKAVWLKVDTGQGVRWVRQDECRLQDGQLAFEQIWGVIRPIPDWFVPPEYAMIRQWNNPPGLSIICYSQICSAIASAEEVLGYYTELVRRAGLVLEINQPPVGRATPGFSAFSDEIKFFIDAIQYRNVVYWAAQIGAIAEAPRVIRAGALKLIGRDEVRLVLGVTETREECWAPATALADVEPIQIRHEWPSEEPITWLALPEWLQFPLLAESERVLRTCAPLNPDEWRATIDVPLKIDWRVALESCLAHLDSHGFDATGTERPNRSYYLVVGQWGHRIEVHVVNDGDRASVTCLDTLGHMTMHVNYEHHRAATIV
jgi:hypothetical protein